MDGLQVIVFLAELIAFHGEVVDFSVLLDVDFFQISNLTGHNLNLFSELSVVVFQLNDGLIFVLL